MNNFVFNAPTQIFFGKGQIENLPMALSDYGKNVLLVYGGGSIKKMGLYEKIMGLLGDYNVIELSGVEPNPKIETVRKGVKLCKDNNIDVVLAVGGGSTIDCSKVIAAGAMYEADAWDLVCGISTIENVLPVVSVLTLAATGSEMNKNAVISDMSKNEKIGVGNVKLIPKKSILDPEYTYSVSKWQTASGTADIMSHIFESYFMKKDGTEVQDNIAEGLLKVCIKYCPIAIKQPDNYEARANLMWASSLALNGLLGVGKGDEWSCHPIEHELSAFYDITHGAGLAIVTPMWMRYVLSEKTVDKFARYAKNVWGISNADKFVAANTAIDKTEEFFKSCGLPTRLSQLDIDNKYFEAMAKKAVKIGALENAYVALGESDVVKILNMSL